MGLYKVREGGWALYNEGGHWVHSKAGWTLKRTASVPHVLKSPGCIELKHPWVPTGVLGQPVCFIRTRTQQGWGSAHRAPLWSEPPRLPHPQRWLPSSVECPPLCPASPLPSPAEPLLQPGPGLLTQHSSTAGEHLAMPTAPHLACLPHPEHPPQTFHTVPALGLLSLRSHQEGPFC